MRPSLFVLTLLAGGLALAGCVDDGVGSSSAALRGECGPAKTLVCHVPPGDPGNAHPICISPAAVAAHQAHGDHPGACDGGGGCAADGEACSVDGDCCDGHCNSDGSCGPEQPACAAESEPCDLVPCCDATMFCDAHIGCYRPS